MSKKTLTLVGSAPLSDPPSSPRPRGPDGRVCGRIADIESSMRGGMEMLTQACLAMDRIASLSQQIANDGVVVRVKGGGLKEHPVSYALNWLPAPSFAGNCTALAWTLSPSAARGGRLLVAARYRMTTRRTPIRRPRRFPITPEAIAAFRRMEAAATDDEWAAADSVLHRALGAKPWQWPVIEYPDVECPYPAGCHQAELWQQRRDDRPGVRAVPRARRSRRAAGRQMSGAAQRQRRLRERERSGRIVLSVELPEDETIELLLAAHLLDPHASFYTREDLAAAVERFLSLARDA